MEIREVHTYDERLPFTGYGIWLVFELKYRKVQLIHPIHFTELILSEYAFIRAAGSSLWPINNSSTSFNLDRFKIELKNRIKFKIENGHSVPMQIMAKVISELEDISIEEALRQIGSSGEKLDKPVTRILSKVNREYKIRDGIGEGRFRGRQKVILDAIRESGPVSIYQITHLVEGRLKSKSGAGRVVTYYVNKLTARGILEIV